MLRAASTWLLSSLLLLSCTGDDAEVEAAGEAGQPCIGEIYCNGELLCVGGVCMPGDDDGDGDGDTSSSDTSDPGDGDGDGDDGPGLGLYEGPCADSDDCAGETWCAYKNGRSWCATDCMEDSECPPHASANAAPMCEGLDETFGTGPRQGCVLDCEDEGQCPTGAQCFYSGLGSKNWCGYLDP